jgi:hypothetical protein
MSQFLAGKCISATVHTPSSPDLVPAAFWLFPELRSTLKGKRFSDIPLYDFKNCLERRPKSWKHCKEHEGDYFEKL